MWESVEVFQMTQSPVFKKVRHDVLAAQVLGGKLRTVWDYERCLVRRPTPAEAVLPSDSRSVAMWDSGAWVCRLLGVTVCGLWEGPCRFYCVS